MSKHGWLSIREPMDRRFRSAGLAQNFMGHASESQLIVDLGCGTGTNCRYLSRDRGAEIPWLCIDVDGELLETAAGRFASELVRFERADLATDLSVIPNRCDVSITASAFLDITSEDWLGRFANRAARSPLLISMTASGSPIWDPIDDLDEAIGLCLENHRQSDHGFGPAAGSFASQFLANELSSRDCNVSLETSDWRLGNEDTELLSILVDGVCRRASAVLPSEQVERWAKMRRQQNQNGVLKLTLPHLDLLSLPR